MKPNEKQEIREQLRSLRAKRDELNRQAGEIKKQKSGLEEERKKLLTRAEKIGLKIGQKKATA